MRSSAYRAKANPIHPPTRIPPVGGCLYAEIVENGDDVGCKLFRRIGWRIVGLIALPVTASVDQDEAVFRLQCRNVAWLVPNLAAIAKAVLEDERWSIALDPVVDRNAFVDRRGALSTSPVRVLLRIHDASTHPESNTRLQNVHSQRSVGVRVGSRLCENAGRRCWDATMDTTT